MLNGNRMKSHRSRSPRDMYETPLALAEAAIMEIRTDGTFKNKSPIACLDVGCGGGVWGEAINHLFFIVDGIDIEPKIPNTQYYDSVVTLDYLHFFPDEKYDVIIGNPPYSLAEEFIRHSFQLLRDDGIIYFLLRLSFLEGIKRCRGLFKEFPLKKVYVCSRRPSFFSSDGEHHTTDTLAYAMFLWQKGYYDMCPDLDFLDWDYK